MQAKYPTCSCPRPRRRDQSHRIKTTDCADISDIIDALSIEDKSTKRVKRRGPPKFKTKPFKPRHYNDTCVPMVPSMHTRLRYIGHCSLEPPLHDRRRKNQRFDFDSSSEEENDLLRNRQKRHSGKSVTYYDMLPHDILLPTPVPVIKHTGSCQSILNVASPTVSGENIPVQRASVKPGEWVPPLPPKAADELYKPHSGIVINRDKDFVPDVVHISRPNVTGESERRKPHNRRDVCRRKICSNKKCRKYAAARKRRKAHKIRTSSDRYFTTIGIGSKHRVNKHKPLQDDDSVCGLDDIPTPEHVQIPSHLKPGMLETHSLTVLPCSKDRRRQIHYGILQGSFNMYDGKFGGRSRGRQALTVSVMAYCLAFHYHPKQWTMKLVDNLVDSGDKWYQQCLDKVHDHSAVQGICEVLPFGKKQTLHLNGKYMQVLLGEPDFVGYTMSLDPTVYNLCRGLKAFFKDNRAGVLLTRVLKVVIWKDKVCFYIFDPAGRDSKAYSNFTNGRASLINVKDLDALAEILLARSIIENQKFVLAAVKVLKMIDENCDEDIESDREFTQAEKAMMGYRILNESCAIVNGNMHLGDPCFETVKYKQALTIAIVAMIYAKISPPNTWFTKTLDKILRLGSELYAQFSHPKVMIDLTIDNIPNEIVVGPYLCDIIIYRERVKGQLFTTKECLFNIRTGLEELFSHEYTSGILEFNSYSIAVWRQKDMFYLFDPYPRTNDGLRALKVGRACCLMLLNKETVASVFTKNWDYLPATTQFHIHAFKVLKLKKKELKNKIMCTLSDDQLPEAKGKQNKILPLCEARGDGKPILHDVLPVEVLEDRREPQVDEEYMGDITSLVDSIQEDYLRPIPLKYKNMSPETLEPKIVNLDSPTVSVTQVVPPWPKPRDKTNEPPEPDPDPEPTPPPTPPILPPPEGGEEEEEDLEEEEDDDETRKIKMEEMERKKAEEEEARRKAEELPPPLPPPPPSPQPESEPPLATPVPVMEDEIKTVEPVNVHRRILLTEDAKYRSKLRQTSKTSSQPLVESQLELTPSQELVRPSNFKTLLDNTQIIRGTSAISDSNVVEVLPFAAIMAIVTSYKYSISTWTGKIVNFVIDTANKLYANKLEKFQLAPMHIIPRISIGHQTYHADIDVIGEGATWQLENILTNKYLTKHDRGMITTCNYSCAFFMRNGLFYLFDASTCNAMGLRESKDKSKGKACLLRFRSVHDLVSRILFNKDGKMEDQQFILSKILVRRLLKEPRMKLPEDYNFETGQPKSLKSKSTFVPVAQSASKAQVEEIDSKNDTSVGYQLIDGGYRIEGTTSLKDKSATGGIKRCHFVGLVAMLMATMHPIRTWNQVMVDVCIEKGIEIHEKATNLGTCEKRVIKNIILDGKLINVNIKKITVINENPNKRLEQYLNAVLRRLRYVLIRFPSANLVVCRSDGYYHIFDPYPSPGPDESDLVDGEIAETGNNPNRNANRVATWTLYRSVDSVIRRIRKIVSGNVENPEFYTFELTSVKTAPKHSALNYKLSPLFKPDENPNMPYMERRKVRPTVDEKMYWLEIENIPWSRMIPVNDLGFNRKTPRTLWRNWDIEFPGDLYSLWGTLHPTDTKFDPQYRGKQYLATNVVAIAMIQACDLSAWTSSLLDGIVECGDKYHKKCADKLASNLNHEIRLNDLDSKFDMFPYSFTANFEKTIYGFVYNIYPDRFNLNKALEYFFEKHQHGILTSPAKNLAFGKYRRSYFLFDCQSYSAPIFSPGQGSSYILKCESINRLIYCMTITMNIRRHDQQFHLYTVTITLSENAK